MYVAGIDVGTSATKVAIVDEKREVLVRFSAVTGNTPSSAAEEAFQLAIDKAGVSRGDVSYIVSTGFGRYMVPFRNIQLTDFTSHALGALYCFPNTHTVLDIGSNGTRASRVESNGRVKDFKLNDKCAAGAGMFLVRTARFLEMGVEDIGPLCLKSQKAAEISSVCTVLGETEIINHLTAGTEVEDIVKGVVSSLAHRAVVLLKKVGIEEEVTLTGGTARNIGMVNLLEEVLERKINFSADGQEGSYFSGAIGAALGGYIRLEKPKE
ncbi:acyl-CoA dehydratase activase [Thermodesulfobacteriota bacterium]